MGFLLILIVSISYMFSDAMAAYHPSLTIEEHMPSMSFFSEQVIRRYYIIQHFALRMQIVSSVFAHSQAFFDLFISECSSIQFRSNFIQEVLGSLKQAETIEPFFQAWHIYMAYSYIEDVSLNDDMWICLDCMMRSAQAINSGSQKAIVNYTSESLEKSSMLAIIFRFYFLKKIEHSVRRLRRVSFSHMYSPLFFDNATTLFRHPLVQSCIKTMIKQRTLKPFFSLYSTLSSYDHLMDTRLYRDFAMLTLFILNMSHTESIHSYVQKKEIDSLEDFIQHDLGLNKEQCITYIIRRMYHINRLLCAECSIAPHEYYIKNALRPLLFSWIEFSHYGHLKDQLLVDSLAQELYLLSNYEDGISQGNIATFIVSTQLLIKDMIAQDTVDVDPYAHIDTIIERLYYIYRVENIVQKIVPLVQRKSIISGYELLFSHNKMVQCYQEMLEQSSIKPYVFIRNIFEAYYYISDAQFTREYIYMLYVIIISVAKKDAMAIDTLKQMSLSDVIIMIEEIIESIGEIGLEEFSHNYWWQLYIKRIDSYLSALFN